MTRLLSGVLSLSLLSFSVQADIYSASNALSRGDYETAVKEFTKLAEAGDDRAQANLGYMYYVGEGVPQDYKKAVEYYRKAAVQGNKDAQYNLAVSYAFGEGVKQDLTEAAIWYRRAGEQGHAVSQYSLGISYAYGEGVPQDQKEAARWFKKAAEQGYSRAQVQLGSMYHTGEGVEQNYEEAVHWYRMAADRGDATAQYNLGTMYRSGKGVEQNYAQAKRWFRQSADQGYAAAQNELASLERAAGANVATRTVQAKPQLFPEEPSQVTSKQEIVESSSPQKTDETIPVEPEAVEQVAKKEPTATIPAQTEAVNESTKKPLFTVEKKDLLTLDNSELDIATAKAEPEHEPEPEIKKESVKKIEEPVAKTETIAKTEPEPVSAPDSFPTNTAASESETSTTDETKESGGFFSAIGKIFSSKENTTPDNTVTETESIADTVDLNKSATDVALAEKDQPAPKVKKEVVITPRVYPEDVKAAELAAIKKTEPEIKEEIVAPVAEEPETIEITENKEPASNASMIDNDKDIPDDNPSSTKKDSESGGGFFSALGNIFKSKEPEVKSIDTPEQEDVLIAKVEEKPVVAEEITTAQKAEDDLSNYSIDAGRRALLNQDYDEAVKQFTALAEAGDSEAQAHLGSLYYVGKGVKQDFHESYNWYKKSADQGNQDAQYSLGNMYLLGEGVNQDNQQATKWYELASAQGHIAAKNNLENLKKLEELNRLNQMQQDALAKQNTNTETSVAETPVEETIENNKIESAIVDESTYETEKKPGLLGLLGGLFESSPDQEVEQKPESTPEQLTETEPAAEPIIVEEAVVENHITESVPEPLPGMEENKTASNDIASTENPTSSSESPGFFKSLFGSNEKESTTLQMSDEIQEQKPAAEKIEVQEEVVTSVEEKPADAIEENKEKQETLETETIAEANTEEQTTEKSDGIFGFFGKMFSSDEKNEDENTTTEEVALAEPVIEEAEEGAKIIDSDSISAAESTINEIDINNPDINQLKPLAVQGNADAQYKLGTYYYSGTGVKQDYTQAALWYRRAAEQGNVDAQYSLGNMYLMGEGIGQDDEQAAHWYSLAADQGHESSKHNLSNLQKKYIEQTPVVTEVEESSNRLMPLSDEPAIENKAASETGEAEYKRGLAYAFGDGVPQNDRTAFNHFLAAAEKGYALAQYKVGVAYAYGEGVRQDYKKAAEWYRKSAEQGYTIAQRNLATMYLDGNGIEQDKVQALAWYQIVASGGNAMDMRRRDMLQKELSQAELSKSEELANQITARLNKPSS